MKKLFFSLFLMIGMVSLSTSIQAQTSSCTPAQIEACKKICGEAVVLNCTPAQKAACQKVCSKGAKATTVANQEKTANTQLVTNFINEMAGVKKVGQTSCSPKAKTVNNTPSCGSAKKAVVETEKKSKTVIAQTVSNKAEGSEKE